MRNTRHTGPNCEQHTFTRRDFLKIAGAGTAALAAAGVIADNALAKKSTSPSPETAVKRLYGSLSDEQKQIVCLRMGVRRQPSRTATDSRRSQLAHTEPRSTASSLPKASDG